MFWTVVMPLDRREDCACRSVPRKRMVTSPLVEFPNTQSPEKTSRAWCISELEKSGQLSRAGPSCPDRGTDTAMGGGVGARAVVRRPHRESVP